MHFSVSSTVAQSPRFGASFGPFPDVKQNTELEQAIQIHSPSFDSFDKPGQPLQMQYDMGENGTFVVNYMRGTNAENYIHGKSLSTPGQSASGFATQLFADIQKAKPDGQSMNDLI